MSERVAWGVVRCGVVAFASVSWDEILAYIDKHPDGFWVPLCRMEKGGPS